MDAPRRDIGIIHLDLPARPRNMPAIMSVVGDFFAHHVETIDMENSLVVLREDRLEIHPA